MACKLSAQALQLCKAVQFFSKELECELSLKSTAKEHIDRVSLLKVLRFSVPSPS